MTSCLLLKAPDRIAVVADGRLSVNNDTVSFNTTEKIRSFTPKYSFPVVSVGRFDHYSEYKERDWGLAYAGTYALVSLVVDLFIKNISGGLYLDRNESWEPTFAYEFDESVRYDESFVFDNSELPKMVARVILDEFKAAAQLRCNEWSETRGRPDCEFLLFGEDAETRKYVAHKITIDLDGWHPGDPVRLHVNEVSDGVITSIGSAKVAQAVNLDDELQAGSQGWHNEADAFGFLDHRSAGARLSPPTEPRGLPSPDPNDWGVERVMAAFAKILRATDDPTVGGELTTAYGFWYGGLQFGKITL